jgi:hypothetical protein
MPLAAGELAFGLPLKKRRLHSVASAAREYNIHVNLLQGFLIARNVVSGTVASAPTRLAFDADKHSNLLSSFASSITVRDASRYAELSGAKLREFCEAGYITPSFRWTGGEKSHTRYVKNDIDSFVNELTESVPPPIGADVLPMKQAAALG